MFRKTVVVLLLVLLCGSVVTAEEPKWYALISCTAVVERAALDKVNPWADNIKGEAGKRGASIAKWRMRLSSRPASIAGQPKTSRYVSLSFLVINQCNLDDLLAVHAYVIKLREFSAPGRFACRFSIYTASPNR